MKLILFVIILFHGLVISKLIFFPYPELFVYPYLTNHGMKPYQQILDQHFPGLLFLPLNFDNLGMRDAFISRVWLITIVILTQLLLFFISKGLFKSSKKALLVNLLYLIWQPFFEGWVFWIDSILPLILLPAFYAFYKNKLFLCGLFLGIGIVFKQTLIPLSFLIMIYLFWKSKKFNLSLIFLSGLVGPVALMILYLTSINVTGDFWYWTIVFNLTTYAKYGTSIPTSFAFIARVLLVYLSSFFGWFGKDKRITLAIFIFLIGSLAGVFDRANFVHFQPSLPFAILATSLGVYQLHKQNYFKIMIFIYLAITFWWLGIFYKGHISYGSKLLSFGEKVLFFDDQLKLTASKIRQLSKPNDKIFVFGAAPNLYQLADRLPAGDVFVFQFPWFLKIAGGRLLEGIIRDKPEIVISDRTVTIEDQPITEFASQIDEYIQKNYKVIDNVGTIEILRRVAD